MWCACVYTIGGAKRISTSQPSKRCTVTDAPNPIAAKWIGYVCANTGKQSSVHEVHDEQRATRGTHHLPRHTVVPPLQREHSNGGWGCPESRAPPPSPQNTSVKMPAEQPATHQHPATRAPYLAPQSVSAQQTHKTQDPGSGPGPILQRRCRVDTYHVTQTNRTRVRMPHQRRSHAPLSMPRGVHFASWVGVVRSRIRECKCSGEEGGRATASGTLPPPAACPPSTHPKSGWEHRLSSWCIAVKLGSTLHCHIVLVMGTFSGPRSNAAAVNHRATCITVTSPSSHTCSCPLLPVAVRDPAPRSTAAKQYCSAGGGDRAHSPTPHVPGKHGTNRTKPNRTKPNRTKPKQVQTQPNQSNRRRSSCAARVRARVKQAASASNVTGKAPDPSSHSHATPIKTSRRPGSTVHVQSPAAAPGKKRRPPWNSPAPATVPVVAPLGATDSPCPSSHAHPQVAVNRPQLQPV